MRACVCVCVCVSVCECVCDVDECVCVTIKSELLPLLPAPACDLVSLGAVEISDSGHSHQLCTTVESTGHSQPNLVNFKASKTIHHRADRTSNGRV